MSWIHEAAGDHVVGLKWKGSLISEAYWIGSSSVPWADDGPWVDRKEKHSTRYWKDRITGGEEVRLRNRVT